ncbi:MAG: 16S rRNA (guanine(966)-N(2))-methyltransferase RsmD [Halioglobus sp.]
MSRGTKGRSGNNTLRIIGGLWRGRKLSFIPTEGLRPTTDRVRETLFNWLAADIQGAQCLDLFAGSGALGLESLSRGAAHCDFVDTSAAAIKQLRSHLQVLDVEGRGNCHADSALSFLAKAKLRWDIVFVDPPFGQDLLAPACDLLARQKCLAPGAMVYIESGAKEQLPDLPANWEPHREKKAGGVSYRLFIVHPE